MTPTNSFQGPKGTRDFYPDRMAVRRHIESAWRSASIDSGFSEIEGPMFEQLELYTVKSGAEIVSQLFSFRREGGEDDYALRPEFTPTLARMAAAKGKSLALPTKWFSIPNLFRAERPQRGRLREHVQWNLDVLGLDDSTADVEVISTALLALERLGLGPDQVKVRLSHRGSIAEVLLALGGEPGDDVAALAVLAEHFPEGFAFAAGGGDGDDLAGDGIDFGEAFDAVVAGHFSGCNGGPEHGRKLGLEGGEVAVISTVHEGADAIHAAFFEKIFDDFPVGRIPSDMKREGNHGALSCYWNNNLFSLLVC